jgi:cytochrome c5/nitrate/TMAO reductase-like tetraheme cytochrome c subunit
MKPPALSRLPENIHIPGLYPPKGRMPKWPIGVWFVLLAVVAIPLIAIPGVVLARHTTSDSVYCLSCHAVGDIPDRGVPSVVHPGFDDVSCVDCHAKPGQIVFEGYIKGFMAEEERVSSNCVRCHSSVLETTDNSGFRFNALGIVIDHRAHLERGATCVSCHANVAHDLREPQTNRPTMESCYSCHSPTMTSCMQCHTGGLPSAPAARELVGRKPVQVSAPPLQTEGRGDGATVQEVADGTKTLEEGRALYAKACASCHGGSGGGLPSADLSSRAYLEAYGAEELVRATAGGRGGMPALGIAKGGTLQDAQVEAIIDYLIETAR